MEINFNISGEFIDNHIRGLIEEGNYALAFKTAESCLGNPNIGSDERIGLAFDIICGKKRIVDDEEEGCISLEDTGVDVSTSEFIVGIITSLQSTISDKDREIDELCKRLNCIYDACAYDYPEAIRAACIDWVGGDMGPRMGEGYLFGDRSIPRDILSTYDTRWGHLYDKNYLRMDKDDPVSQFIEAQSDTEDRLSYGWLDQEGNFYEVAWGHHEGWARDYLKEHGFEDQSWCKLHECGDELCRRGWVLLHDPMKGIAKATMNKNIELTPAQKRFLEDYYKSWGRSEVSYAISTDSISDVPKYLDAISL